MIKEAYTATVEKNLIDVNSAKKKIEDAYKNFVRILNEENTQLMNKVLHFENDK